MVSKFVVENILSAIDELHKELKFRDVVKLKEYVRKYLLRNDFEKLIVIPCEYIHEESEICGEYTAEVHKVIMKRLPMFKQFIEDMFRIKIDDKILSEVP